MSKKSMRELRDMLCEELDGIAKKGELTAGSLETVDKLTHSIKSIDTIIAMDEGGYSEDGYDSVSSYAGGRGRNARRDSMGRYSRDSRGGRGYSRNGYSMDDSRENMIEKLHEMLDEAPNEKIKNAIHRLINQLDED